MARTETRPTQTTPATPTVAPASAPSADDFTIESVEWVKTRGGTVKEPEPKLVAALTQSWANRVVKGNSVETPASKIVCSSKEEVKLRTRQIREAGAALNIGVGIREVPVPGGKVEIHFRARKRRGSGEVTQPA